MDERFAGNKRNRDAVILKDVSNLLFNRHKVLNDAIDEAEATRLRLMALKARKKPAHENPLTETPTPTYKTLSIS